MCTNIRKRLKTLVIDHGSEVKIPSPVIEDIYRSTELIVQRGNGLINLIQNALNTLSGNPNGTITIEAYKRENDTVIVNISDNGQGISADIMDKVFVPFFTTEEKGSGIGLSLSRRIMQLHGATIWLRSAEGKGTTVVLTFPGQIP